MTMPNFLVIGAAKCGTESLCNYLGQHPDVFISPTREPNFFVAEGQPEIPYCGPGDKIALSSMWVSSPKEYKALFDGVTSESAIGEGTAWYIYFQDAPARIERHIPKAKLIAILRNPVDRAYSAYTMLLRDGRESVRDFGAALALEERRIDSHWEPIWYYYTMGFYTQQLLRYYEHFDREQIKVILYDDFNKQPAAVLQELFRFLEVDDRFQADTSIRLNQSKVPKNLALHQVVAGTNPLRGYVKSLLPSGLRRSLKERIVGMNVRPPDAMPMEVRRKLIEAYRPEVGRLSELLECDLSHWLTC